MYRSIVKSSNVYYYSLANELGVDLMHEQLSPFGFGRKTGIDIDGEVTGVLPSTEWKRSALQEARAAEVVRRRDHLAGHRPGLQQLHDAADWPAPPPRWCAAASASSRAWCARSRTSSRASAALVASDALAPLPFKPEHVELISRALHGVTQEGTSVRSFAGAPYKSGGKTGTAQAVGIKANEKYNASKLDEHQRDHSLYIAFAPLEAPTIALAVIVENAGFGSEAAAPIARRVFDYCAARPVSERRRHRADAARQVDGAGRQAARRVADAAAGQRRDRGGRVGADRGARRRRAGDRDVDRCRASGPAAQRVARGEPMPSRGVAR